MGGSLQMQARFAPGPHRRSFPLSVGGSGRTADSSGHGDTELSGTELSARSRQPTPADGSPVRRMHDNCAIFTRNIRTIITTARRRAAARLGAARWCGPRAGTVEGGAAGLDPQPSGGGRFDAKQPHTPLGC